MPRSMKMAEIKRILKLAEENSDLSERKLANIVGCSKNTIKAIRTIAEKLSITYDSIKDMDEEQIHNLFYPNNNPYQSIPEPDVDYCIDELKKKHVTVKLLHEYKVDDQIEDSINQIKEKDYLSKFNGYKGKVLLVGITFDSSALKHESKIEYIEL